MQIREIYDISHKIGLLGASSPREYIDLQGKSTRSLAVKTKMKESYFADLQKIAKQIPGPGRYEINPEDQKYAKKVYKKINFKEEQKKTKKNFIEEIVKEKKGIPGPGKYEIIVDKSEKVRHWHSILGEKARKKAPVFKSSIFDDCHVDCINVAPGSYQTQFPLAKINKIQTVTPPPPESDEKKDKEKGSKSLPKLPGAQNYHPIPPDYETFEKLLTSKGVAKHSDFAKQRRFSLDKEASPGPKYSLIAQWASQNKSKKGSNIFKSTANLRTPSIYN